MTARELNDFSGIPVGNKDMCTGHQARPGGLPVAFRRPNVGQGTANCGQTDFIEEDRVKACLDEIRCSHRGDDGRGFVSFLVKGAVNRRQTIRMTDVEPFVRSFGAKTNVYVSAATFQGPSGKSRAFLCISVIYLDLDTYNVEHLKRLTNEEKLGVLHEACAHAGIPPASYVVDSGNGLQVKWVLSRPIPRAALPRWKAVLKTLQRALAHLGADSACSDPTRLLRLVGSRHAATGRTVSIIYRNQTPTMGGEVLVDGVIG